MAAVRKCWILKTCSFYHVAYVGMTFAAILNLKKFSLGHVTVIGLNICCGDLTIVKMAAVRHLEFYTFAFLSPTPCQHTVLLFHTKFR